MKDKMEKNKTINYGRLTFFYLVGALILTYLINTIVYFSRVEYFSFGFEDKPSELSFFLFGSWNFFVPYFIGFGIIIFLIIITIMEVTGD